MEEPRDTTPIPDPVMRAVLALVNAQTWVESRSVMEARRDALFDPAALRMFELLLEQYSGDAGRWSTSWVVATCFSERWLKALMRRMPA